MRRDADRRGLPSDAFDGRPHIAIANTASDLTPCNAHLNEVARSVSDGIYQAGGIPLNLPVVSLGETQVRPTAMLWRNMAAMAIEEMLRANPIDGVVLLGGCDKTIPSLLMAASSVDLPAVVVPGGPMLTGTFRGVPLGCGTDVWKLSEEVRAGTLSAAEFTRSESSMIRSRGHCNTMGTASTMGLLAEVLGMTLPGIAGTPAPDSRLLEMSHETGVLIVEMVQKERRPSQVMTRASFVNAIVALAALGGSTNAVVHLLAIAGRLGVPLTLDDFDRVGADVPLLVDLQPAGRFLMEDFFRAGGLHAVLAEVRDLLDPAGLTVTGRPLVEYLYSAVGDERAVVVEDRADLVESPSVPSSSPASASSSSSAAVPSSSSTDVASSAPVVSPPDAASSSESRSALGGDGSALIQDGGSGVVGGGPAVVGGGSTGAGGGSAGVGGGSASLGGHSAVVYDREVIRARAEPLQEAAGIAVLYGNLAPDGAVIKPAAASPALLRHRGPAVVFDSVEDLHARLDDPALEVTPDSVLVLRGCGPKGYPGMPEVANMPLPAKLLEQGVRDMVRICDGRMSGTAYGTVVLHVAPEAAAGGPLALVRTGDMIVLDVPARRLYVDIPDAELLARTPSPATVEAYASPRRGWEKLYVDTVGQANTGADLDFLIGSSGDKVSRESH